MFRYLLLFIGLSFILLPSISLGRSSEDQNSNVENIPQEKESEKNEITLPAIEVIGERTLSVASDNTIRNRDFMNYPRKTASDLMRFIPGLHITQHTGGAKAHQIFLRGFDAEHGQDIAAFIDGIPINEVSHIHGQGYLDLHFIIPESVSSIKVMKGPYDPRYGNFATAGVIDFIPYKIRDFDYSIGAGYGSERTAEGICHLSRDWQKQGSYLVAQGDRTDGYTDPGELKTGRAFFSHYIELSRKSEVRFMYTGYRARSEAADILPKGYIDYGYISRFNAFDDSNRVDVDRHLMGLTYESSERSVCSRLQGYYNYKNTEIFSNYTFYYFNPVMGDQLEQSDGRHYGGLQGFFRKIVRPMSMEFSTEAGFSARCDLVDQTLANTVKRRRYNVLNRYDFNETALGVYLDERVRLTPWLRLIAGIRYDVIRYKGSGEQDIDYFNIHTNLADTYENVPVSFDTYSQAVSPKASVVLAPIKEMDIFINFGRGFVSSQARQIAWNIDHSMPSVTGGEAGARIRLFDDMINLAGTGWFAEKESEYIFDSESGSSMPLGKSRRRGLDFEMRISPWKWIYLGTDVNYVKARFVEDDEAIPNMSEWLITNVISVIHPDGYRGALRGRYLGQREHDLGFESSDYYIVDMLLGYEFDHVALTLSVENIFDVVWYDSVFAYHSRPVEGDDEVVGLHVTPGTPRMFRVHADVEF